MSERLVTKHEHNVEVWQNGLGLQWDMSVLPSGSITRISWPHFESSVFRVLQLTNRTSREATTEEITNFVLLASEQNPDNELVEKMRGDATEEVINRINSLKQHLIAIKSSTKNR